MINSTSLRSKIVGMEVGETIVVPVSEYGYTTIRSYASDLGFAHDRRYTTHRNRQDRTYTIKRES